MTEVRRRWRRLPKSERRWLAGWATAVVLLLTVAAIAGAVAWRSGDDDQLAARHDVEFAAAESVRALMTFGPDDDAAHRTAVAGRLTGLLAADYAGRGPDVVFPGAVESEVAMSVDVLEVAVQHLDPSRATALVFADQTITAGSGDPDRVGVARWAELTRVDGKWRLAGLGPVSPQ
ncbi:MAG: hypothetical protein QM658_02260 [Gordonia sp. (in: high G+C Gram-positive bacteria)]